jgi:RNase P subunit RPR2
MCNRHEELFDAYQKQVTLYTVAIEALKLVMARTDKQDHQRHHEYVEQARTRSEQARLNLELHIAEHGCNYVTPQS